MMSGSDCGGDGDIAIATDIDIDINEGNTDDDDDDDKDDVNRRAIAACVAAWVAAWVAVRCRRRCREARSLQFRTPGRLNVSKRHPLPCPPMPVPPAPVLRLIRTPPSAGMPSFRAQHLSTAGAMRSPGEP